jgi:prolipoprotein diacylglyceryltransferase
MMYLMLASTFRFLVEFLRLQPKILWGLSEAQYIAVALFLAGYIGLKYFERKGRLAAGAV